MERKKTKKTKKRKHDASSTLLEHQHAAKQLCGTFEEEEVSVLTEIFNEDDSNHAIEASEVHRDMQLALLQVEKHFIDVHPDERNGTRITSASDSESSDTSDTEDKATRGAKKKRNKKRKVIYKRHLIP